MPLSVTSRINDAPSSDIKNESLDSLYSIFDEPELAKCFMSVMSTEHNLTEFIQKQDCFLNITEIELDENPVNLENIKELQDADQELQRLKDKHPEPYFCKDTSQTQNVLCYVKLGKDKDENWKILITNKLLNPTIKWFI